MTKHVRVVQGLIIHPDTNLVLMAHRPPDKKKPLMWEYPGGKVDFGEDNKQALARELKEELDIEAKIGQLLASFTLHENEDLEIHLFAVREWKGEPRPLVATALEWVDPRHAIDWRPCLPGTFITFRTVMNYLEYIKA